MTKFLRTLFLVSVVLSALTVPAVAAEVTTVQEADFTILEKGTPESPVSITYLGSSFFYGGAFAGYSDSKTYEAGGMLLIKDGGYVSLPRVNLSANGGIVKVVAEVKINGAMGMVGFALGYSGAKTVEIYDSEWHTVEMLLTGGSISSQVKISPYLCADGILVKTVKVLQSPGFIAAPVVRQPTQADGTSFTASWTSVSGATAYYIDVYSYDDGVKEYFLENEDCGASLSKKVTGLDPAKTYYYVVRASNGEGTSSDSDEIRVVPVISGISTPENLQVALGENGEYTATWSDVEHAKEYEVTVTREAITTEEGPAEILNEDFAGLTEGTVSSLEYIYERHLAVLNNPGWTGEGLACASGILAFAPFGGDSWVATPALDLSASGGNVTVTLNMAGGNFGTFNNTETVTVQLIDADGNVSSSKDVNLDRTGFEDYEVQLMGGTSESKIKLVYSGSVKLYFESIVIEQIVPAGTLLKSIYTEDTTDTSSYKGTIAVDGAKYMISVVAVGETVSGGTITGVYSDATEPVEINATVGIDDVADNNSEIRAYVSAPGQVAIETVSPQTVYLYDIAGRLLVSTTVDGAAVFSVNVRGVVIAKIGAKVVKLAL